MSASFPQLNGLTTTQLTKLFEQPPPEIEAEDHQLWYEEAAYEIGNAGVDKVWGWLLERLGTLNPYQLEALLSIVPRTRRHRREARQILLQHLEHPLQNVVKAAVDALEEFGDKSVLPELLKLSEHPSPYVVGAVLRFLTEHAPELGRPLIMKAFESPEYIIRESAADAVDELGWVDALPQLERLLTDEHPDVREAAQTAVRNLTRLRRGTRS